MSAKTLPGYLIASLRVKDLEEYMQRYGMPAIAQLKEVGAEIEVASADVDASDTSHQRTHRWMCGSDSQGF